jgi:hypothetical protein
MNFDGLREDKGEHTGGIPQCMLRMSRIPQATKQGAKYARPLCMDTYTYKYDDFGRKNRTISPDTGTTTNVYDEAGNLKTSKGKREVSP